MARRCVEIEVDGTKVRVRVTGDPSALSPASIKAIQAVVRALRDRIEHTGPEQLVVVDDRDKL